MLNTNPTIYADLNVVLVELVATTRAILDDNFCGAYLQGSFAVGDADEYSDVDFVVVTHAEVSADEVSADEVSADEVSADEVSADEVSADEVSADEVSADQEAALRRMHVRFPTLDVDWAKHLEGSYFPKAVLRRPDPSRRLCLYVDNGSPEVEWSNHDNTAVVRWALREYGIALDGPTPASLVDVVTADELRNEIRRTMREKA